MPASRDWSSAEDVIPRDEVNSNGQHLGEGAFAATSWCDIAANPHPKRACHLQRSLGSGTATNPLSGRLKQCRELDSVHVALVCRHEHVALRPCGVAWLANRYLIRSGPL